MLTAGELWTRVEETPLLDEDPYLFTGVDDGDRRLAQRASAARVVRVPPGDWAADVEPSGCGLLVLEGRVLHRTRWRDRVGSELLSRGDVVQPWADDGLASLPLRCGFRAVTDVRLAVLDDDWMERMSRWPTVSAALTSRAVARARRGTALMAVMQVRRLDLRIWLLLWLLADRFGRVHADGVYVDLPLTHRELAELAGARRPSLSAALARLARGGNVRRADGAWILSDAPPV